MATPILDPTLPVDNSLISAGELRGQFQAIASQFGAYATVTPLGLTVSNPPTQAQVQALADKIDEIITALQTM
jgi:hypothetical protein